MPRNPTGKTRNEPSLDKMSQMEQCEADFHCQRRFANLDRCASLRVAKADESRLAKTGTESAGRIHRKRTCRLRTAARLVSATVEITKRILVDAAESCG